MRRIVPLLIIFFSHLTLRAHPLIITINPAIGKAAFSPKTTSPSASPSPSPTLLVKHSKKRKIMEFPSGRHHEHQRPHHRDEEQNPDSHEHHRSSYTEGEEGDRYPVHREGRYERPPGFDSGFYAPPPPNNYEFQQESPNYPPPPPPSYMDPEPGYSRVQRISHEPAPEFEPNPSEFRPAEHGEYEGHGKTHHHFSIFHHSHERSSLPQGQEVRVFCRAETGYSLTIQEKSVVLARSDPNDEFQHWIKDEKYSTRVKDEEGFPSFALVNKATGLVLKHSIGATHPVQLTTYKDELDESILWTESRDTGDGFRAIRMVNNIKLNLDAFNGDKKHGGVRDGTTAVLWEWKKGDNQKWKIVPYCK